MDQGEINQAIGIPFKSNKHKCKIVRQELRKNRYVEVWHELQIVYSAKKWGMKQ